jgi:chromosomal replication initiation ATPase DnaA
MVKLDEANMSELEMFPMDDGVLYYPDQEGLGEAVCWTFNLTLKQLGTKDRRIKHSYPRAIYWYVGYKKLHLRPKDLKMIGKSEFSHSDVINAAHNVALNHHFRPQMKKDIETVESMLVME